MKDYERYMNRQKLSETGMAKLVKLETEKPEKRAKHVPQWVKYCGMAACLAVAFGVFALAILQGGGGIDPNPIANASATPAAEELYFNEVDEIPFTRTVTAYGSQMKVEPLEIADVALLFGSSEDDFEGFKEDMGWGKFDMEYFWVDMSPDSNTLQFLLRGDYVSPSSLPEETEMVTSFTPVNTFWLQIYEGYSYIGPGNWEEEGFTACEVNGHKVIAACDRHDCQAGAVFDVEAGGKTYGVRYTVTTDGERSAKELVTKLVQRVTKDGLFPETYKVGDDIKLRYAELTQTEVSVDRVALAGETNRPLTREELEAVYPVAAGEDGENYIWYGTAYYKADGNLRVVSIQGDKMDETASVNIVVGETEADAFTRNLIEKDGKPTYFGADHSAFASGLDLLRCFYVNEPGYFNAAANAYHCYAQYQVTGDSKYVQVRTCVEGGSLLENETFNKEWLDRTAKGGLWFHTGNINGKDVWDLPVGKVELNGVYYMEADNGDALGNCAKVTIASGKVTIASERLNYHTCTSTNFARETQNGTPLLRVVCDKCKGIYSFEIIDGETLRFDMDHSAVEGHHSDWTLEVTHGTTFRHLKDGEKTTTLLVWGEATHHPEPSDHVEATHHPDEHNTEATRVAEAIKNLEAEVRHDIQQAKSSHHADTHH